MTKARVAATEAALALIGKLVERHGPLMFHLSGGCCDGSAPMCFPASEFHLGERDVLLGEIGGVPFYTGGDHQACRLDMRTVIDVAPGRGGSFSLEAPEGVRFLARSEMV